MKKYLLNWMDIDPQEEEDERCLETGKQKEEG